MTEGNEKQISLDALQPIELKEFDATPFIGEKAIVDEVEIHNKTQVNGTISYYVKFKALVSTDGFNGEPLFATRIVGIQQDEKGNFGWGDTTKMAKFLKAHKVNSPKDLKGKTVIIQRQEDSNYLTF